MHFSQVMNFNENVYNKNVLQQLTFNYNPFRMFLKRRWLTTLINQSVHKVALSDSGYL